MWDLAEDRHSIALIEQALGVGKPVAAVCHAPGIFRHTRRPDGAPLVQGLQVTGFSNSEEEAVQLTNVVPFLVEEMLQGHGALYSKGADWLPYVQRDVSAQACQGQAVVEAGPTPGKFDLLMLDPTTGADRTVNVDWNSSLTLQTTKARARPCGYWLAPTAGATVDRLKLLGLSVSRVAESGSVLGETFSETGRADGVRQDVRGTVAGGEGITKVNVSLVRSLIDVPAGSYYVPLNQPLANLVVAALEPDTQNSYFANHLIPALSDTARVMTPPSLVFEEAD